MRRFLSVFTQCLNPKHYLDLGEKRLRQSGRYLLSLVGISFVVSFLIGMPSFLFFDMSGLLLNFNEFNVDFSVDTLKPVGFPPNHPIIGFDTTGNMTMSSEIVFVTDDTLSYQISNLEGEIPLQAYNIVSNRPIAEKIFTYVLWYVYISIFFFLFLIYLLKYAFTIAVASVFVFVGVKALGNLIHFKRALVLGIYTSTIMVVIEVLTLPFSIKNYLLIYSPYPGVHFSWIAMTAYITLFITAVRLNGSKQLY